MLPLFSCPSTRSWGIGEIGDIPVVANWMRRAGFRLWQLLPLNEMAPGQNSPYSAISAMATDPIYISLPLVPEFQALGGEDAFDTAMRGTLAQVRAARSVDYWSVLTLKERALRNAFARFLEDEWARNTSRAQALRGTSLRITGGGWQTTPCFAPFTRLPMIWPGRAGIRRSANATYGR